MESNLEFTWASPNDESSILDFLSDTFGSESIQAVSGRCRWMYFDNPLGLHVSVCRSAGDIVAVCGHLPKNVNIDGEEMTAGFGVDFMVAEPWRRRGIGRQFLAMRLDRFRLGLSLGQSAEMGALYRNLQAIDLGHLHLGVSRPRPTLSLDPRSMARNTYAWIHHLRGRQSLTDAFSSACSLSEAAACAADSDWFEWRYGGAVYGDYHYRRIEPGSGASGFIVFRKEAGWNQVVDLISNPGERPSVLAEFSRNGGGEETRILFTGNRLLKDCRRAGFWIQSHNAHLMAMTHDSELRSQLVPGVLEFTAGSADADLLRFPARP